MKNQPFHHRLKFAINGIYLTWKKEASFRFQTLAAVAAISSAAILKANPIWWALILIAIGMVLSAELFNTALEAMMDRLHPERHPSIKLAKDCAAGAVLVLSLISLGIFVAFLVDAFGI